MIDTAQNMAEEAGVPPGTILANLSLWKRQGRANPTGRYVDSSSDNPRRRCQLWDVLDYVWDAYLGRKPTDWSLPVLTMTPKEYKKAANGRQRRRLMYLKKVYRRLRAESFSRRHPFVVLESV